MKSELQKKETVIDSEIVMELIAITPEWWNSISLEVDYFTEQSMENYDHSIFSKDNHRDVIIPSEKLFELTYRLGILFKEYGKHWKKVKYDVEMQEDGGCKYKVRFEY